MTEYTTAIFEDVRNENGFRFFKLRINGKCQFEEFYNDIRENHRNSQDNRNLDKIIALMDFYGVTLLPKEKFRMIKDGSRSDVFEFKAKNIRVYVVIHRPEVYIVMGGYKANQEKDINRLLLRIKGFGNEQE